MSRLRFIDRPSPLPRERYESVLTGVVERLAADPGVRAIYRLGSLGHPGISDLDVLAVFDPMEGTVCRPLAGLDKVGQYAFTHSVLGVPSDLFPEFLRLTAFHGYELVESAPGWAAPDGVEVPKEEARDIRVQTALEYLIKNWIDLTVQMAYGIVKLRVLLQHVKGLRYDLAFLGREETELARQVGALTERVDDWFTEGMDDRELSRWIESFRGSLEECLEEVLDGTPLRVPDREPRTLALHLKVEPGEGLEWSRKGVVLPPIPMLGERRFFNLLHRLNRFVFRIPQSVPGLGGVLDRRFRLLSGVRHSVEERAPGLAPPLPGFTASFLR